MAAADLSRSLLQSAFVSERGGGAAEEEDDEVTFVRAKEVAPEEPEGPVTPADLAHLDLSKRALKVLGHCEDVPRPCPYVSCRHNLYLDVGVAGEVRFNFPMLEPGEMPAEFSCAMDVIRTGAKSDGAVAELLNDGEVQVELLVRRNLPLLAEALRDYAEHTATEESSTPLGGLSSAMQGGVERGLAEDEEDRSGRVLPDRLYVHEYPEHHAITRQNFGRRVEANLDEEEYLRAAWKVYARSSKDHLEEIEMAARLLDEGTATVLVVAMLVKRGLEEPRAERTVARAKEVLEERRTARARHGKRRRPPSAS